MKFAYLLALLPALAFAAPAQDKRIFYNPTTTGSYSQVSADVLASWVGAAHFTSAAACDQTLLAEWACGAHCTGAGSDVTVVAQGGDNTDTPYYYVAVNGSHIIVSIKGTNTASIQSWLDDLSFSTETPDSTQFPGSPGKVHGGFLDTFESMRPTIYSAVAAQVAAGYSNILVTGHSLGAACANIASVYLQKQFTATTVTARLFAPPRVGNPDWADYVDATLGARSQFMVIHKDLVPHVPTLVMDFRGNEVWNIDTASPNVWRACQGQENDYCSDSVADSLSATISSEHSGPYMGVTMGCA